MNRRSFVKLAASGFLQATAGASLFAKAALAASTGTDGETRTRLQPPDANGLMLPAGFRSRVVATGGEIVPGTSYRWHLAADGGACFPVQDENGNGNNGGHIYVSNSEVGERQGGVGALRFDADGSVTAAYSVCTGTNRNCAGGPTPWGTWLTCEEVGMGQVYECDPQGRRAAIARPLLGVFNHEGVAADPVLETLYLTEDRANGLFYRFTPSRWGDLSAGVLEAALVDGENVTWAALPDPQARGRQTRSQLRGAKPFYRGEGIVYADGHVFFATTGDHRIWDFDIEAQKITVLHDGSASGSPLSDPDNLAVSPSGELIVAEDPGNLELVRVDKRGNASPLVRVTGQQGSEIAGPAFDPSGQRLYFSSQRGGPELGGITYEIKLPS